MAKTLPPPDAEPGTVYDVTGLVPDGVLGLTGPPIYDRVQLTVADGLVFVPDAASAAFLRAFPTATTAG